MSYFLVNCNLNRLHRTNNMYPNFRLMDSLWGVRMVRYIPHHGTVLKLVLTRLLRDITALLQVDITGPVTGRYYRPCYR